MMCISCLSQVVNSTILQQVFVVEFVVQNQMCDACHRQAAQDYWKAVVQVRQKVQNLVIMYMYVCHLRPEKFPDCCRLNHVKRVLISTDKTVFYFILLKIS